MSNKTFLYFAYGSNMSVPRLRARAPSALPVGQARVGKYRLVLDKWSRDGSAKADCERTQNPTDKVIGGLYRVDASERLALDKAEGAGQGYEPVDMLVVVADGSVNVLTYLATDKSPKTCFHTPGTSSTCSAVQRTSNCQRPT